MDQEAVNALESTRADLAEAYELLKEYHKCQRRKASGQLQLLAARLDTLREDCKRSYKEWISVSASRPAKRILRNALLELRELTYE